MNRPTEYPRTVTGKGEKRKKGSKKKTRKKKRKGEKEVGTHYYIYTNTEGNEVTTYKE
jgi:hypothetical protein